MGEHERQIVKFEILFQIKLRGRIREFVRPCMLKILINIERKAAKDVIELENTAKLHLKQSLLKPHLHCQALLGIIVFRVLRNIKSVYNK